MESRGECANHGNSKGHAQACPILIRDHNAWIFRCGTNLGDEDSLKISPPCHIVLKPEEIGCSNRAFRGTSKNWALEKIGTGSRSHAAFPSPIMENPCRFSLSTRATIFIFLQAHTPSPFSFTPKRHPLHRQLTHGQRQRSACE